MDGRGRVFGNIFIERPWRPVKYKEVYLHSYESIRDARNGLVRCFRLCNTERFHKYLGYKTPHEVFFEKAETTTHRLDQSTFAYSGAIRPPIPVHSDH